MNLVIALFITLWAGYLIYKKYAPQGVIFLAGLFLLWAASAFGFGEILPMRADTGSFFINAFEVIHLNFSSLCSDIGLSIMCVGAFAKYMERIGASDALVRVAIRPLRYVKSPYVVLACSWVVGMCIGLCVNSASGLGMLLMVTMFPVLVALGVSRLSAASVMGTTMCFDWSPADVGIIMSADIAGIDLVSLWMHYSLPIILVAFLLLSPMMAFAMKYFDEKEKMVLQEGKIEEKENVEVDTVPKYYAMLPILPLALIILFSDAWIASVKMHLVNAMLIGFFVSALVELVRLRRPRKIIEDLQAFFDGMGLQMVNVVILLVAGKTFADGLISIGAVDMVIAGAKDMGAGPILMLLVMVLIMWICSVVMGSNVSFYAFADIVPSIVANTAMDSGSFLVSMLFASSIGRTMSPIAAVIIICAGMGKVSPFAMVRRLALPMIFAMLINVGIATGMYLLGW